MTNTLAERSPLRAPKTTNGEEIRREIEKASRKIDALWREHDDDAQALTDAVTQITVTTDALDVRIGDNETNIATINTTLTSYGTRITTLEAVGYTSGVQKVGSTVSAELNYIRNNLYTGTSITVPTTSFGWTTALYSGGTFSKTNIDNQALANMATVNAIHGKLNDLQSAFSTLVSYLSTQGII